MFKGQQDSMKRYVALQLSAAALLISTPAWADHPAAGGGVSQSGPVVTVDAQALPAGTLVGGLAVHMTRPDAYTDAELIALAGQHVHAHTTDYNVSAAASLAYGVTGHLTLSASLPLVLRDDLRAGDHSHAGGTVSNTVEPLGSVSGVGDLSLMAQHVLAHDHGKGWFVALLAGLKLPTGSTHETDLSGSRLETEHQPGTGSWDPLFGLAASKSWGPWSAHANALYQLSTEGAQATQLGDRLNVNGAVVYALSGGDEEHEQATGAGEHEHEAQPSWGIMLESNYEREGRQRIAGVVEADSGSEVLWLSPGLRFTAPAGWSAAVSAGIPLWQDVGISHPENSFRLFAQVGTRF
jgi:hypothetical protein